MNILRCFFLACILVSGLAALPGQAGTPLTNLIEFFNTAKMHRTFSLGMGNFTYAQTKFSGAFSIWVQDLLKQAVVQSSGWRLINSAVFDNIDPKYRESWGSLNSADNIEAVVTGHYQEVEGSPPGKHPDVILSLELTDMTTGTLKGRRDFLIGSVEYPASVPVQPPNLGAAQTLNSELQVSEKGFSIASAGSDFEIKASTNRGQNGVYRDGEALRLNFYTTADAWVKVYHIDAGGVAQLIFPNRFHKANFVKARTTVAIPGPEYTGFAFLLHEPFGTEFIKVVASSAQFSGLEDDFAALGQAGDVINRDRGTRTAREARVRETVLNYTIVPSD